MSYQQHQPVLLDETIEVLSPKAGEKYLDLTAGWGGHAAKVASMLGKEGKLTLVDRDDQSINRLKKTFGSDNRVEVIRSDFCSAAEMLSRRGDRYNCILADIGISSIQLDEPARGFSFDRVGPLDMRMDKRQDLSGYNVINEYDKERLRDILVNYGDLSRRQAESLSLRIVQDRPVKTTDELAAICKSIPTSRGKRIEAQVFQAVRIETNDELGQLARALPVWARLLAPGGRVAIISFHSLEDRIVKKFFVQHSKNRYEADLKMINKKPIIAATKEKVYNPRARSAKLRAAVKK